MLRKINSKQQYAAKKLWGPSGRGAGDEPRTGDPRDEKVQADVRTGPGATMRIVKDPGHALAGRIDIAPTC